MLDLTGIMFSSLMMLYVAFRALRLDRAMPWFQHVTKTVKAADPQKPRWRQRA